MTVRTQTRYPTTVVSDDAVGTLPWSNPDKAEVEDNDPATATGPGTTEYLLATGYGFNLPSNAVPLTATPKPRRKGAGAQPAWTVIGSQTLESAAASVSFAGISTTYRMFRLTAYFIAEGDAGDIDLRFNADSSAVYDYQRLRGSGTTLSASRATGDTGIEIHGSGTVSDESRAIYEATIAKQSAGVPAMVLSQMGYIAGLGEDMVPVAGCWNNTSDLISRIDLVCSAGSFAAGSVFVLEAL